MTPMSGRQMSVSRAISPKWFIPSSRTASRWPSFRLNRVRGTPMSLLKLLVGARVRPRQETTETVISRVEVFPLEPVMATNLAGKRFR